MHLGDALLLFLALYCSFSIVVRVDSLMQASACGGQLRFVSVDSFHLSASAKVSLSS
jgi:hypothetical protein